MSKLKPHQVFYIENKWEAMTPQELAAELGVPVRSVNAVLKKIAKAMAVVPPESRRVPEVNKPKVVWMDAAHSKRADDQSAAPDPLTHPRLRNSVAITEPLD